MTSVGEICWKYMIWPGDQQGRLLSWEPQQFPVFDRDDVVPRRLMEMESSDVSQESLPNLSAGIDSLWSGGVCRF